MNKKTMSYHLTPSERAIMDILWHEKSSMSQSAIIDKAKESGTMAWKERSIFSMINSLLEKGIIEEDSFIRSGKTYARTFKPTTSRAEFYARRRSDWHRSAGGYTRGLCLSVHRG